MDGMGRPCGVDVPDAEGSGHVRVGILQNAEGSVKQGKRSVMSDG